MSKHLRTQTPRWVGFRSLLHSAQLFQTCNTSQTTINVDFVGIYTNICLKKQSSLQKSRVYPRELFFTPYKCFKYALFDFSALFDKIFNLPDFIEHMYFFVYFAYFLMVKVKLFVHFFTRWGYPHQLPAPAPQETFQPQSSVLVQR